MHPFNKDHIKPGWRLNLFIIIFESDTPKGKAFDVALLIAILSSIIVVMLETVGDYSIKFASLFFTLEWSFTVLFTLEYVLRILVVDRPRRYIFSFYGIIDLLSIIPTFLSLLIAGSQYLLVIRAIRLLRVFRVLKLTRFMGEAEVLRTALLQSMAKITVFIGAVITLVVIMGCLMYLIEGPEHGFRNIPISVYWAIVTLTTVGYGDIAPETPLGQIVASVIMILGYGIIAVPTGIVSVELSKAEKSQKKPGPCPNCGAKKHAHDAKFCRVCGYHLFNDAEEVPETSTQ
ncbi:MAG TPA: ion transporter [Cytophagales bacterium]|nr:ion transporter [Cytophagales bacterium]HAA18326.1 ion transporter [Cytophagales bacterium]HAP59584.1 ion transporter [Cytophagales bacterium]